ncbi:MAG TPA: protein kinase [Gemmatimonadales bacterium]|nr:protein kinase [Gemmatimonadales bacterium]
MADLRDRLQSALGPAYRVESELGGGGMSRVFLAEEVRLGRRVVVKVLPPELAAGVSAERFEREIQLAAKLQHPHIVPVLTAGAKGDLLYYVMPHIAGESLRARIAHARALPVGEAVRILRDVCDALAYAHGHGVVHRDIKPDNVLLSGKHALVTDFGVAKAVASSSGGSGTLTSLGMALGTPAYMAPEQAAGDPNVDQRADLYAVGALGYELLAGRTPFGGLSPQGMLAAQVTATPDPVTQHRDSVPPALAALIMRCLAKHPADRPQSADDVLGQLEAMATPTGATLSEQSPISSGTQAALRRSHPVRVATLFGFAALGVLSLVRLLVRVLGLPDWAFAGAVGLAAAALPFMLWTGAVERRRARAGAPHWLTWRRALVSAGSGFGLLGLVTATHAAMRQLGIGPMGTLVASGVLAERDRLVLADFENRTRDSTLGPSLTEALRVDLAQSGVIRLLDAAAVGQALARMGRSPGTPLDPALARELAQREGAKAVVHGQIDPLGRGYVVSAELVSAADGTALVSLRETAQDDGAIIAAVDRLSGKLRERIGESLKTIRASDPLEQVTTRSLEALRKYSQGVRASDAADMNRAVTLLEQAIALDTTFAMAYRKLAVVLSNSGGAQSRIAAAATQAFRHRDRLTPFERDLAEAYYYSRVDYDPAKTEAAYRAALEQQPENGVALNNLSLLFNSLRRFADAESLAVRGLAVAPTQWALYTNTAVAQIGQAKYAAAGRTVGLMEQRSPTNPLRPFLRGFLALAQRHYDSAEVAARALAETSRDPTWQSSAAGALAAINLVRGKLGASEVQLRRAMVFDEQRGVPGNSINDAIEIAVMDVHYRNAPDAAQREVEAALRRHPLASIPAQDRPYLGLAWLYADAGHPDRARQLLAEYESTVPEGVRRGQPFRFGAAAQIALAEGRIQDAIRGYRTWYDQDGCAVCGLFLLGRAYERAGQRDSALAVYERAISTPGYLRAFEEDATLGPTYRRLGELYEERGQLDKARDYYGRFIDLWKDADPELQPLVRDVKQRLARLTAEPRG